jgi:hypothetical protein
MSLATANDGAAAPLPSSMGEEWLHIVFGRFLSLHYYSKWAKKPKEIILPILRYSIDRNKRYGARY